MGISLFSFEPVTSLTVHGSWYFYFHCSSGKIAAGGLTQPFRRWSSECTHVSGSFTLHNLTEYLHNRELLLTCETNTTMNFWIFQSSTYNLKKKYATQYRHQEHYQIKNHCIHTPTNKCIAFRTHKVFVSVLICNDTQCTK